MILQSEIRALGLDRGVSVKGDAQQLIADFLNVGGLAPVRDQAVRPGFKPRGNALKH